MVKLTRRQLARFAVDKLLAGQSASVVASKLAAVLATDQRKHETEFLIADIDRELEDRGLVARARVSSAHPLSQDSLDELSREIQKLVKVEAVSMETELDKQLLGGLKIETANHSWDKTIRRRLNQIRSAA